MGDFTAADRRWMRRALVLARRGWGQTAPNPLVGAVLVRDGVVVGEGWHAAFGAPHAEAVALAAAADRARGATAYVTLEPCNHVGKTPACSAALIRAGVARVVFAANDPNPVAAGGADALRAARIVVESGLAADDARSLNPAFHSRFARQRPFVTLKLAVSIDGAIAGPPGHAGGRFTGTRALREVHRMRAVHDAIAVGSGTVLADDPQLTVRGVRKPRVVPVRIVFDRRGRLGSNAQLVRTARKTRTIVVTADPVPAAIAALAAKGVESLPAASLHAALRALHGLGIDSMLCEGGAELADALLAAGAVDRMVIFQAPVLLGAGAVRAFALGAAGPRPPTTSWRVVDHQVFGQDMMTVYEPNPV